MTATLPDVTPRKKPVSSPELDAAKELVRLAKEQGLALTGPDGLLKALTKTVLETALNEELTEHLGYDKHDPAGLGSGNIRNGTRAKTVLTDTHGLVEIDVPRDRAGTFEPQIVRKRQRRLTGVDEMVLSLYAKGLTTGEISAHFAEIYGASVSKETISRITDKVVEEMQDWSHRPLDEVYAAVFIDAIVVKVRDGQVANRPIYAAIGVTLEGEKDVLGLWAGTGGEGAKFWMAVLTDLRNRGIKDVFFLVCDGLKGLPDVVVNVWPQTIVQTCIIHLISNTSRLASRRDWDALKRDLKGVRHRGGHAASGVHHRLSTANGFPSRQFAINAAWLELALVGIDLLAWTRVLLLDSTHALAEPKKLRYRLPHVAARIVRTVRRVYLRIAQTWPWANELATAYARLVALPRPAG
jgi:transposase-like protein